MTSAAAKASTDDLRYPIGRYQWTAQVTAHERQECVRAIEELPGLLRSAVGSLIDAQLDTPYRPGGWTVRQVIHHVADSHLNSYVRYRLALTEDNPAIRAYDEKAWAELPDAKRAPVGTSLALLDSLHERWTALLRQLTEAQWARTFEHPERGPMRLDATAGLYAWHGLHHLAHIRRLRERERW